MNGTTVRAAAPAPPEPGKARRLVGWGTGSYFRRVYAAVPLRPVYLVDSDPARWGTRVCGIEVRPPRALADEDPRETVVVIYSRARAAIAASLRALGPFCAASPFELPEYTEASPRPRRPDPGGALWLEEALEAISIERPVLLLGKGPGLARTPRDICDSHFVISVNQALAAVRRADLVFSMDLHNLVHVLFAPEFEGRWGRAFVPDGLNDRWDCLDVPGLPYDAASFEGAPTSIRRGWTVPRISYEDADRVLDFSRFGDHIVRFELIDAGETGDPVPLERFAPGAVVPHALVHHANSAHFALYFLWRKGVREIRTAGMGCDDGYAAFDFAIEHAQDHDYIRTRWVETQQILRALDLRIERLEDLTDAQLRRL